jgi:hypothetical protein
LSLGARLRSLVPVLLLVLVAAHQIRLARTGPLSPWKGGGFGMFSTSDSPASRRLRIVVHGEGGRREIEVPSRLVKLAAKAVTLPDPPRLRRLAAALVEEERREGRAVERVELDVWSREFSAVTLFCSERPLARYDYSQPAAIRDGP